ncbi:MAG TPA: transcription antitermination factor NusB [Gemmatimonadales bacterium]|nr:transcription antitermination factor NusB [Gemmatimonadales bacterium]
MRAESKRRARALQLLYALEAVPSESPEVAFRGLARLTGPEPGILEEARAVVDGVLARRDELDRLAQAAADNWRLERIATIERNILRLGVQELLVGVTPVKVVLDESVWLAQRFAGERAPAFINGVLDRVARSLGRL